MLKGVNKILLIAVLAFISVMTACNDNADNDGKRIDWKQEKEKLEEANRHLLKQEKEVIDEYIKSHNLDFVETGTGLRYRIISRGDGKMIKTGDIVTLDYEMSLLNGEIIYSSDNDGLKVFKVGRGGVESGLEEAILNLRVGDEAEIIIPAHLAHGLIGDGNKIPPRSVLVYYLKIIDNYIN